MEVRKLTVYTDGSCNKQREGGYGFALVAESEVLEITTSEIHFFTHGHFRKFH